MDDKDKSLAKRSSALPMLSSEAQSELIAIGKNVEFAENPESRCPCVLLLDTSASMKGEPIDALNKGLRTFKDDLIKDPLASLRVEVAVVTFDSRINVVQNFITVDEFEPPTLTAQWQTYMGTGILKSLDMIEARKKQYRANGITYYRPWLLMVTDGEPEGESDKIVKQAAELIRAYEIEQKITFYAVGVRNANMARLSQIATRRPIKLRELMFEDMFIWLSNSMEQISYSLGKQISISSTEGQNWSED